jgi:hypothetical protein
MSVWGREAGGIDGKKTHKIFISQAGLVVKDK